MLAVCPYLQIRVLEFCIGQPISEIVGRRVSKVAVSPINHGVVDHGGKLVDASVPGHHCPTGWVVHARQNIQDGIAGLW